MNTTHPLLLAFENPIAKTMSFCARIALKFKQKKGDQAMSEYVTVEVEYTDNPNIIDIFINQILTHEDEEIYSSPQEGEVGSPVAQMLFTAVDGIQKLTMTEDCLTITRDPDTPWESIIDEVRDALRDWYL